MLIEAAIALQKKFALQLRLAAHRVDVLSQHVLVNETHSFKCEVAMGDLTCIERQRKPGPDALLTCACVLHLHE